MTSSREIIKEIEADGRVEGAVKGSHHQFRHPNKPGRVTVPHPMNVTLPKRLLAQIDAVATNRSKFLAEASRKMLG